MTSALLMTALLIAIVAAAALLRARLPRRLLALAPDVALLIPISLILISISHALVVFDIAIGHETYSSFVEPSEVTLGLPAGGSNRNRG
jgi:hypothetical protein